LICVPRRRISTPRCDVTTATSRTEDLFVTLATEYYVAGRFASTAGLVPVYGNLLHHAVENYLKAALAKRMNLEKLRRRGHKLKRLWRDLRASGPSTASSLGRFDATIKALDRFERIRYPPVESGMFASTLGPGLSGAGFLLGSSNPSAKQLPKYEVSFADVDRLIIEGIWPLVFGVESVPGAMALLSKDGYRALRLRNGPFKKLMARARRAPARRPKRQR